MELEKIKELLEARLSTLGYSLYSLKTRKEKGDLILEIVVDRVEPISLNDITDLSTNLSDYLDELDPIEEAYMLDVSSLGAEKPLKVEDLKYYVGSYINLHLVNPVEGKNIFEGDLTSVNDDELELSYKVKTKTKTIKTKLSNIYKVRLAIKF